MTCDLSTYSLELGEDSWQTSSSDTSPLEPSNSTPIAAQHSEPDETTDGSQGCGCMSKTSGCSIHPSTPDEWISSQAASLASILALLEEGLESRENGRDSGVNSPASFAWYDPDSHSLKTAQCSLVADSMSSSPILPRSGTMRNGRLYPRPRLALPTGGRESGYWPTPTTAPDAPNKGANRKCGPNSLTTCARNGSPLWQTPVADDAINRTNGKINSRGEPKLSAQVKMWPTPTVCGNHNRKGASATSGDGLATAVKVVSEQIGGSLNPTWVAWLMGWPMNWFQAGGIASQTSEGSLPESKTGLVNSKPSATGKSRSRQPPPGKS